MNYTGPQHRLLKHKFLYNSEFFCSIHVRRKDHQINVTNQEIKVVILIALTDTGMSISTSVITVEMQGTLKRDLNVIINILKSKANTHCALSACVLQF